jgi:hypothetical protein
VCIAHLKPPRSEQLQEHLFAFRDPVHLRRRLAKAQMPSPDPFEDLEALTLAYGRLSAGATAASIAALSDTRTQRSASLPHIASSRKLHCGWW